MFKKKYTDEVNSLNKLIKRKDQTADYILRLMKEKEEVVKYEPKIAKRVFKLRLVRNLVFVAVSVLLVLTVYNSIDHSIPNGEPDGNISKAERKVVLASGFDKVGSIYFEDMEEKDFYVSEKLSSAMVENREHKDVYFSVMVGFLPAYEYDEFEEINKEKKELLMSLDAELEPVGQVVDIYSEGYKYCAELNHEMIRKLREHGGFALKFNTQMPLDEIFQKIGQSGKEVPVKVKVEFDIDRDEIKKQVKKQLGYSLNEVQDKINKNPELYFELLEKIWNFKELQSSMEEEKYLQLHNDFLGKKPYLNDKLTLKDEQGCLHFELNFQEIKDISEDKSVKRIYYNPDALEGFLEGN